MQIHPGVTLLAAIGIAALLEGRFSASIEVPLLLRIIPGAVTFLAAAVLLFWAIATMLRFNAQMEPNREPSTFVTTGPYHFSRNPMYVANVLFILGFAWLTWSVWFVLLTVIQATLLHVRVIPAEERLLKRAFPEEAAVWFSRTRRWL